MYIEDRLTGERIISVNYQLVSGRNVIVSGTNPETGEGVDWSDRAAEYLNNYMATQPKKMRGPKDVLYRVYNNLYSLSNYCLRNVLWRLHSDGKTDNYLRLERCSPEDANVRTELDLDYLEFCPISICDNEEIPEE
jgi:hypothetical protein